MLERDWWKQTLFPSSNFSKMIKQKSFLELICCISDIVVLMVLVNVSWGSKRILDSKSSSVLPFSACQVNLSCHAVFSSSDLPYDVLWTVCLSFCVISPQSGNHSVQAPTTTDQVLVFRIGSGFYCEKDRMMAGEVRPVLKLYCTLLPMWEDAFRS